jgi:hypothetical protein
MKRITVRSNTGEKDYHIPERWSDVTVNQYQKIVQLQTPDLISVFSILCNEEYNTISNIVNPELERTLFDCIRFISEQPFKATKVPKVLVISGKELSVPTRIGGLSIGQSIHVRQKLEECRVYEEAMSIAVACYLQPKYDRGEFDYDKALELEKTILELPITEIYPIGFFLLKPLTNSGRDILSDLSRTIAQWFQASMRKGRTLVRWLRLKDLNRSNI